MGYTWTQMQYITLVCQNTHSESDSVSVSGHILTLIYIYISNSHKIQKTRYIKTMLNMYFELLKKNQTVVTRWVLTLRSWVSHFVSTESCFSFNNLQFSFLIDTGHKRSSCNIISVFMDVGGKSSQQNIDCLLGHCLDPLWGSCALVISTVYDWGKWLFHSPKQACLQQRELLCWRWI